MSDRSPVKQFNQTIEDFLEDLKKIFGPTDREIAIISTAFELTRVNVRLFLTPFQASVSSDERFVQKIMAEDADYFIGFDFATLLPENDETGLRMMNKFKQAAQENRHDKRRLTTIFNWFKVMIYYAKLDQGVDLADASSPAASSVAAE